MAEVVESKAFRLGDWSVDPVEGTVSSNGVLERLEPKVMAVLVFLVRNRDRVVGKDEILRAVWPDAAVEEVALARSVSEIRRALGDDAKAPRFIETFPKRGYKLIAPVVDIEPPEQASTGAPRAAIRAHKVPVLTVAVAIAVTIAVASTSVLTWFLRTPRHPLSEDGASVAVLPFDNLSEDPSADYFADGMTEDVITQLSKIDEIRVISRTSVLAYATSARNLQRIGIELGVRHILEGSVRREGNRIRIVAQLLHAETDSHLWAETYDRELSDIFDVQRDVAERIADALRAELTPGERTQLAYRPTGVVSVYDTFLRARTFYERLDLTGTENAIRLLEQAVETDPRFALGYAGLADAYARRSTQATRMPDGALGVEAAMKALALEPELPEAQKALGHAYAVQGQYRNAIRAYEEALELRPNYREAINNLAVIYSDFGELDRALQLYRRAVRLDPARAISRANFGSAQRDLLFDEAARLWLEHSLEEEPLYFPGHRALAELDLLNGRHEDVVARMEEQLTLAADCFGCRVFLGLTAQLQGDLGRASAELERATGLIGDQAIPKARLGQLAWLAGDRDAASRWWDEAAEGPLYAIEAESEWWGPRWALAAIASARGDVDGAVRWYEAAYHAGRRDFRWDEMDPLFQKSRSDPAFRAVLQRMRDDVQTMRARVGEDVPLPPRLPGSR